MIIIVVAAIDAAKKTSLYLFWLILSGQTSYGRGRNHDVCSRIGHPKSETVVSRTRTFFTQLNAHDLKAHRHESGQRKRSFSLFNSVFIGFHCRVVRVQAHSKDTAGADLFLFKPPRRTRVTPNEKQKRCLKFICWKNINNYENPPRNRISLEFCQNSMTSSGKKHLFRVSRFHKNAFSLKLTQ